MPLRAGKTEISWNASSLVVCHAAGKLFQSDVTSSLQPPGNQVPRTMRRILTLEIPEHLYRALEGIAAREGRSPEAVGTTWLIDAIARRANQAAPPRDGLGIVWEGPL